MSETILLAVIFILAAGYFVYKLYPKKSSDCGCGGCSCKEKSK
ncbi:FeoB-associated Cys-rich membrane protein [Helicobacter sp. MIT 11-5569]|nr:FeoB-associated Cys-rich membrane protein [Helicobacter sp. MIT 11-5569]TLD81227.1 FeoB-associated Cys-rich membrane protein [Helicobacter sp. MIT 11-5569]